MFNVRAAKVVFRSDNVVMNFGPVFSLFVVFDYFCIRTITFKFLSMDNLEYTDIRFCDSLADCDLSLMAGHVLHILCVGGSMGFVFQEVRYNVAPGDYVILPNASLASRFSASADFTAVIMSLSESLVASMAIRSDYGIIGHLSLLQNPVMKLSAHDFDVCLEGMTRLRARMADVGHLFRGEMLEHLLMAHVLDLYDIHARGNALHGVSKRTADLLLRFVRMLHGGEYMAARDLGHYASRLCVTPHYLSEVCRKVSGRPATYWIDRFTVGAIVRMLGRNELSLTDISERFGFSSLSYFSRYVQRHIGLSPSQYRNDVARR